VPHDASSHDLFPGRPNGDGYAETGVYLGGSFRVLADRDKLHQTVKPIALMAQLVTVAPGSRRAPESDKAASAEE
jgi:hypothetical protein